MFEDTTITNLSHISECITDVPSGSGDYNWYTNYVKEEITFSGVRVTRSLVLCVVFCISLFVLCTFFSFGHCVVFSFRFTDSDNPFSIFKLFLTMLSTVQVFSMLVLTKISRDTRHSSFMCVRACPFTILIDSFTQCYIVVR